MSTIEPIGSQLHGDDPEARKEAARMMGKARTPKKTEATRANIARVNEQKRLFGVSEETRAKLREAQILRREREKQERLEALGESVANIEKKPVGRQIGRAHV